MFESIINILLVIGGIAVAVIPLVNDIKKEISLPRMPKRKVYTRTGSIFLIISFLTLLLGATKYMLDAANQKEMTQRVIGLQDGNTKLLLGHSRDSFKIELHDLQCQLDAANAAASIARLRDSLQKGIADIILRTNEKADTIAGRIIQTTADQLEQPKIVLTYLLSWRSVDSGKNQSYKLPVVNAGRGTAYNVNAATLYFYSGLDSPVKTLNGLAPVLAQGVAAEIVVGFPWKTSPLFPPVTSLKSVVTGVSYQNIAGQKYHFVRGFDLTYSNKWGWTLIGFERKEREDSIYFQYERFWLTGH
jgi:hypothetical protein